MKKVICPDEILEHLWKMKEDGIGALDSLEKSFDSAIDQVMIDGLTAQGLVVIDKEKNTIALTEKGEAQARRIIRAHRLAERLVHDVLREEFEVGACEFEHTLTPELIDGICTLLGHPRECPHGKPIPEGACCKRIDKSAQCMVVPLTDLTVGMSAEIAYVQCRNDQQMHRLDGLQLRPGAKVKLHQKYPTFVIECEGMSIALDVNIASNIKVWAKDVVREGEKKCDRGLFGFRRRHGRRNGIQS